jgi:uncharacterized protein (DUF1778 family)
MVAREARLMARLTADGPRIIQRATACLGQSVGHVVNPSR